MDCWICGWVDGMGGWVDVWVGGCISRWMVG